ncbi:FAD-linked oxidase C-terminal domain-containing protein [soil metagenome]
MNAPNDSGRDGTRGFLTASLIAALLEGLPAHSVLHRTEDTRPYECDGLAMIRVTPVAVVLPGDEEQVRHVLRTCHRLRVPVVARGAGTSLAGGSTPNAEGVVLAMARFNKILAVDPAARVAIVQPGVRNLAISEAAVKHGLYYAPDPSSQIACSIGGNVAENSGGVHCLKYGLTLHNVLRVRGFLMDGEPVEFGGDALDAPGLDLLSIVIGSEGMLAITTEITVKLIPKPALARCIMASFATVHQAGDAVAQLIGAGIIPAGLEMMDQAATRMVEPFAKAGYDLDAAAILLCESDGTQEEVEHEIAHMSRVLEGAGANRIAVSASEAERLRMWGGRKNAFPAAGRVSPDYYCMDGTIPRKRLGEMLEAMKDMEQRFGLKCPNVFHAGDGNLHPLILFDANDPDSHHRAEQFGAAILELCIELGGTITGEHGVGLEKLDQMCRQFDDCERDAFWGVKRAFDPVGLLNPDKGLPRPQRCAEQGRMHVHGGQLPFAELERF